ncbi:MAG TPA: radical SAM protein [Bacteroidia bacterium]
MKFLLTHGYFIQDDPKEQEIMKPYVPLGILYISAYLEQYRKEHEVFDSTFHSFNDLKQYIESFQPDCIAVYVNLMTRINVLKLIKWIKNSAHLKHIKIILGGPEVRYHAEDLLKYGADVISVGEGEQSILEIYQHFETSNDVPETIEGTILLKEGKLILNEERKLLKDINLLPVPNRKKIKLDLYLNTWKERHGYSTISVSTMRGCPYTCKWCSRAVYGGTYRRRSPALVVEELLSIKKNYNPDRIWFVDDVFTISHKWLKEFAALMISQQAVIPYEIITRADRMNDEVIELLKQSGCFRIWIGAESGSQKIIDAMDRRVEVKQVREMIIKSKNAGMEAGTFIMLGYPGETIQDIKETIEHLKISAPSFYTVTVAYPIKGTPLYEEIKNDITSITDWEKDTDRAIDFKRTHSKKFYEYAVRWVHNEIESGKNNSLAQKLKHKTKAMIVRTMMQLESFKN